MGVGVGVGGGWGGVGVGDGARLTSQHRPSRVPTQGYSCPLEQFIRFFSSATLFFTVTPGAEASLKKKNKEL